MTRITIADVAVAAGVSKTAVSFAFNSPEKLGQATVDRVLHVALDLGYTPHPAARALSMRRSGTIGVLIPQRLSTVFANQFMAELMQGLGEVVEEHDLTLLLIPPLDGSLEGAMRRASVDGFISLGLSPDDEALATLDRIGIPTVLIDSEGSPPHPAVNVDDAGGAEAAARQHHPAAPDALPGRTDAERCPPPRGLSGRARRRGCGRSVPGHRGRDHGGGSARVRIISKGQAPADRDPGDERHGRNRSLGSSRSSGHARAR